MKTMIQSIFSGITHLSRFLEIIAEIGLVGLFSLVFVEVFNRYVLKQPSTVSIELCEYAIPLLAFMSAGWVMREGKHVQMLSIQHILSKKAQIYFDCVGSVLVIVFCAILSWKGAQNSLMTYFGSYRSSSVLGFPLWIIYSVIPLGAAVLGLQTIVRIGDNVRKLKEAKVEE
jgi:C4-dicarboxylate transporter, DctQ subunit